MAQLKSWALLQDLVLLKAPLMHSRISLAALSQATKRTFMEEALEVDMVDIMVDIVDLDSDSEEDLDLEEIHTDGPRLVTTPNMPPLTHLMTHIPTL